jgi:hypothetical protein
MWSVGRLWRVLIGLAFIACIACLFGPAERWWGVDLGVTGSAVFHLAMIASTVVACVRPRSLFPEEMALAECRAWVALVFTAMVIMGFAKYLVVISHLEAVPRSFHDLPFRHFQVLLVTLFIAWGVTSGALGHGPGAIESDERDLRLRHAADRIGDWALIFMVIGSVVLLMAVPAPRLEWWLEPLVLANLLIGVLVVKLQVESVALVARYAHSRR